MSMEIEFTCNGNLTRVAIEPHWTLLHLLREELGFTGTKEGCGSGECGACTVIVDGLAVNACIFLAVEIDGRELTSVEGLADADGTLHPLQQSFVDNGGIQCGFCTPGMLMSAKALLEENPAADEAHIKTALAGNICRCTGYIQIFDSVKAARDRSSDDINVMAWKDEGVDKSSSPD
jgi:carbon-monoxide dehydrogenase small subunit